MRIRVGRWLAVLSCWVLPVAAAAAQSGLACGPFAAGAPPPVQRGADSATRRFEAIKEAVRTQPHRILFLGDSLTEYFDPQVWTAQMAPRGVLNAGVSGDRSENLMWRLQNGNLAGPAPEAAIVLIGTNDLTYEQGTRPVEVTAEGVRADLAYLRRRLPNTRIILLGLMPRGGAPDGELRRKTLKVNKLLRACGDERAVFFADYGHVLLDPDGRLTATVSPDLLHFNAEGYKRLAAVLSPLIDRVAKAR